MPADAPPSTASATMPPLRPAGAFRLLRAFTSEQSDPNRFYSLLATDSVALVERHTALEGRRVVDIGGGAGYFTSAFRDRGAHCLLVEPDADELYSNGAPGRASVIGDGYWLPLADASVDVCFSSNVLEHVKAWPAMLAEMVRVTRPGGIVFVTFTNWLSPYGGHETSPWHYLGGDRAAARYQRVHGHAPKNRFGTSLHAVSVAEALSWARSAPSAVVVDAVPRYLPSWTRPLVRLPVLREFLTWNLLLVLRREG